MTRQLRSYQREACEAVRGAWADGMLRPAVVLPTGCGKTDIIAKIATESAQAGARVLALAHRADLLNQITERCRMHDPSIPIGRVQAERNERSRPITVAATTTLQYPERRAQLPRPDVVIVDECHHAASPRDMAILSWAGAFDGTRTFGVTATMVRGDKRGLGDVWEDVVYSKSIRWAIDEGFLVMPRGRAVVTDHIDLDRAKVRAGDYTDGELGEMVEQDVDQIVKAWQEHAADRATVAFTPNVASAEALCAEFVAAGIPAGLVVGSTPQHQRERTYADLAAGRVRVLVSVMVTTEGWDCPPVSCILQCRPTKLPGLYTQMVGRGLRPHPESGKRDCLVLDVVGASRHQRLVTLIDLHETAEYNRDEVDALPCDECGCQPCECEQDREEGPGRLRLDGPAKYSDVDLFAASSARWLFTRAGIRFLPTSQRVAFLWPAGENPEGEALFVPGHTGKQGVWVNSRLTMEPPIPLSDFTPAGPVPLPLIEAKFRAEAWATGVDPSIARRDSPWRRGNPAPSEKQIYLARRVGVTAPETMNKAALSDAIDIAQVSRILDPMVVTAA